MHILKQIKKGLALASMVLVATPVLGQDLLADVAPVDKKMRAVDSVELNRLVDMEQLWDLENPAAELYATWENKSVHLSGLKMPAEHRND